MPVAPDEVGPILDHPDVPAGCRQHYQGAKRTQVKSGGEIELGCEGPNQASKKRPQRPGRSLRPPTAGGTHPRTEARYQE
jgi:hypothetical protein